jgi:hypothetical protein
MNEDKKTPLPYEPPRLTPLGNLRDVAHRLLGKWACEPINDIPFHSRECDEITLNLAYEAPRLTPLGNLRDVAHRLMGKWAGEWCGHDDEHSLVCDEITLNLAKELSR